MLVGLVLDPAIVQSPVLSTLDTIFCTHAMYLVPFVVNHPLMGVGASSWCEVQCPCSLFVDAYMEAAYKPVNQSKDSSGSEKKPKKWPDS